MKFLSLTGLKLYDGKIKEYIMSLLGEFSKTPYPIGSIYMNVSSTPPSELFGGEWEQIQDTFLLASGSKYTAGQVGGESEHTLTVDEMPSHNHDLLRPKWFVSESGVLEGNNSVYGINNKTIDAYLDSDNVRSSGGGEPHNNMPPYLTVYMWKRIG